MGQTARTMLDTRRLLYAGFMCHQVVEKALKGIFVLRNPEEYLPYIHKLMRLANLSGISKEMSEEQLSLLELLSPLNIEARYPVHKSTLMASLIVERCETMIQETEALYQWIRKLIRSQGGIAGVTSQGMADMMALDGGKYGKGILDSCRVKFIMQMEEQEARLVQEKLALTEEETRMITRFRRGEGLLCISHNHVPIAIHVSPKEYEAITTSPTDLRYA